ncbi:hypothetical protein ACTNDG_03470 [Clostridium sp. HCP1S3_B4]|uniref:hypothetical protein n=1 Tax=unclassified Clostridium TaxID=2614128 RepID=UPI003F8C2B7E|nr:hypothetical protein [Clostridiales bacterium]
MVKGNVVTIIILFMAISVINVGCSKDYIDDLENSTSTPATDTVSTKAMGTKTINVSEKISTSTVKSTYTPKSNKEKDHNNKKPTKPVKPTKPTKPVKPDGSIN